ncbi:MAG: DUF4188 domain-containing protein [Myxococcota bacterium]
MASIHAQRMTAQVDNEIVLFLIGMRVNRPWKTTTWLPVFLAMPRMLAELRERPELGLLEGRLHGSPFAPFSIQYWESFEKLEVYAKSRESTHLPAWKAFNERVGSGGDVGIWHETYRIPAGHSEVVYNNMPEYGLAKATQLLPVSGALDSAAARMGKRAERSEETVRR